MKRCSRGPCRQQRLNYFYLQDKITDHLNEHHAISPSFLLILSRDSTTSRQIMPFWLKSLILTCFTNTWYHSIDFILYYLTLQQQAYLFQQILLKRKHLNFIQLKSKCFWLRYRAKLCIQDRLTLIRGFIQRARRCTLSLYTLNSPKSRTGIQSRNPCPGPKCDCLLFYLPDCKCDVASCPNVLICVDQGSVVRRP
jgi:hypothetical protein